MFSMSLGRKTYYDCKFRNRVPHENPLDWNSVLVNFDDLIKKDTLIIITSLSLQYERLIFLLCMDIFDKKTSI